MIKGGRTGFFSDLDEHSHILVLKSVPLQVIDQGRSKNTFSSSRLLAGLKI